MISTSTLCYIENNGQYLMLLRNKKENDMNEGKWIGLGGKIEEGETPDICVLREVKEESGLTLNAVKLRGLVHFIDDTGYAEDMYLYTSNSYTGEITECNEGELHWVDMDKIHELNLWEGDKYFLEKLVNGESGFEMTLEYDHDKCINYTTRPLNG